MSNFFWNRWNELGQLARAMSVAHPTLLRRIADAQARVIHVYGMFLRSEQASTKFPIVRDYRAACADTVAGQILVRAAGRASEVRTLAEYLDDTSLVQLLTESGVDEQRAFLKVLLHCSEKLEAPTFYTMLGDLIRQPVLRRYLASMRVKATPRLIRALHGVRGLDTELLQSVVRGQMSVDAAEAIHLLRLAVRAHHGDRWDHVFRNGVRNWRGTNLTAFVETILTRLPGAPVPWEGDNVMTPVRTPLELFDLSKRMRNCLNTHMVDRVSGRRAFYLWQGKGGIAVASVFNEGPMGWVFETCAGHANADPEPHVLADIRERLEAAGIQNRMTFTNANDLLRHGFRLGRHDAVELHPHRDVAA